MIIGIVYTLVIANFNKIADKENKLTLETLKEYLTSQSFESNAKILCLDDCSQCDILTDGKKITSLKNFLDESVKIYRYDFLYGYTEVEQEVYFNTEDVEEDVCFSYKVDRLGAGEQVLVEFKDKYYDYTTYFTPVKVYNSMADAREAREDLMQEVR